MVKAMKATIQCRVSADVKERAEKKAAAQGDKLSEAVRALVEDWVDEDGSVKK